MDILRQKGQEKRKNPCFHTARLAEGPPATATPPSKGAMEEDGGGGGEEKSLQRGFVSGARTPQNTRGDRGEGE